MSDPVVQIIQDKREDLRDLELFADISLNALEHATKAVRGVELVQEIAAALGDPPPFPTEDALERAKARANDVAKFAAVEKERGFPYLFGIAAVRLWALLEALVDDIVVESLKDPRQCKDQALLARLKGPLLEFRNASPDDQAEFLGETLKQAVDATLKQGAGKFEAVLEPIGLGGGIVEPVRRYLFELSHVRNAIVHKAGKADRRLIDSCPWLNVARGEPLSLTSRHFQRYLLAAYWYLIELKLRRQSVLGYPRSGSISQGLVDIVEELAKLERGGSNNALGAVEA